MAYPRENVTKSSIIKKGNDDDMIDWGDSPFWPFLQHSMIHGAPTARITNFVQKICSKVPNVHVVDSVVLTDV